MYANASHTKFIAAVYYVMNLREQRRNRIITFTQNLMQTFNTVETFKIQGELLNMEWKDYDDFEKYGSDNNLDNYGKRMFFFYTFEARARKRLILLSDTFTTPHKVQNSLQFH
jgi:hypothetical protein